MNLADEEYMSEQHNFTTQYRETIEVQGIKLNSTYDGSWYLVDKFPFQIFDLSFLPKACRGYVNAKGCGITSLINSPEFIDGNLELSDNPISSLKGITPNINGFLNLLGCNLPSLKNIHKHLNGFIYGELRVGGKTKVMSHMLGTLLIPEVTRIQTRFQGIMPPDGSEKHKMHFAAYIINTHILYGRDVLDCQEELISAGLNDFAKL